MIEHSTPCTGVVVGVDGSPTTLDAVVWGARLAARRKLPLDLVQVLPPSERSHTELRRPSGRAHALLDHARRAAVAAAEGLTPRMSVVDGVPGPALVAVGERAQLLVVGARPAVTVGRAAAHVMGHAATPVVVVPSGRAGVGPENAEVLAGVDGSAEAAAALDFAADTADREGLPLCVLVAVPLLGESDEAAALELAEATAGLTSTRPDLAVREVVRRGSSVVELLDEARAAARLVVVGSRGRGAVGGALLGSTSQDLVRWAPCPVAVLSPRASRARTAHRGSTAVRGNA